MSVRRAMLAAAALVAFVLGTPVVAQAQTGAIRGMVRSQETDQPLANARISLIGTNRFATTNVEGVYLLTGVPTGAQRVRVSIIGYQSQSAALTVQTGQTSTLDFTLPSAVYTLDEYVVTAIGEQSKRELANAVSSLDVSQIQDAAPQISVTELLQGKAPGVTVTQPSGTAGTGHVIKIRGSSSINLNNTPLIFVDGARIDNDISTGPGVGGQDASRLNDINPQDIERIEIVKGPSAAALYGTEAAAGVIQIYTKKGRQGAAEFGFKTDFGANFKSAYTFAPNVWNPRSFGFATDTLYSMNLMEEPDARGQYGDPFRTGFFQTYQGSIRGGTEQMSYYVSGEFQDEEGTLPNNFFQRYFARGNFNITPSPIWDAQLTVGYTSNKLELPDNDNNGFGYIGVGQIGFPWNAVIAAPAGSGEEFTCPFAAEFVRDFGLSYTAANAAAGCPEAAGFGGRTFEDVASLVNAQGIERFTSSATLRARPTTFWSNRLTLGYDVVDDRTGYLIPVDPNRPFGSLSTGRRGLETITNRNLTIDYSGSLNFGFGDLRSVTSFGFQWWRELTEASECEGEEFTSGATTCSDAVTTFGFESYNETRTLGLYIQELLAWRDRLFVTPAVRFDDNSAFGQNFDIAVYPKVGASYIAIAEPVGIIDQLKLRVAWGRSGKQPPNFSSLETFNSRGFAVLQQDVLGVTPLQPGNPDLKPERGEEWEGGFDVSLFQNRVSLEASYYSQKTNDVLVTRPLAPSLGFPSSRWENLGRMDNRGFEFALNVAALNQPNLSWDWTINFATNDNEIKELEQFIPLSFAASQRHQEGFPFGSYFSEKIVIGASGDPEVVPVDLALDTLDGVDDDHQFLGQPTPKWEGSVTTSINFLKYLTLYAFLDFKGGHRNFNSTVEFRCGFLGGGEFGGVCPEMFEFIDGNGNGVRDAGEEYTDRAKIIQFASDIDSQDPYVEDAKFAKLRTLSLKFQLPDSWARAIRVKRASLTFAGQNLKTWTGYSGADPEINNFGQNQVIQADFLTLPAQRRFTTTFSVTF